MIPESIYCVHKISRDRNPGIKVVASNGFLKANPSAAQLVEAMALPLADIPNQNNRDLFGGWLS